MFAFEGWFTYVKLFGGFFVVVCGVFYTLVSCYGFGLSLGGEVVFDFYYALKVC